MFRAIKDMAPYAWMTAVLLFFFLPLFQPEVSTNSTELFATERFREAVMQSLAHGQWPLWNPLLGPGGSAAQIYSIIPWDYHLLLKEFFADWDTLVIIDGILMGLSFVASLFLFGLPVFAAWLLPPLSFLFLYTMDFVHFQAIPLYYDSLFIAFVPLLALTFRLEKGTGKPLPLILGIAALFTFAFHGSKIEVWGIQLPIVLAFWILGLRVAFRKKLFVRSDWAYLAVYGFGLLANAWQIYWLQGLIAESGRAGLHGWKALPRATALFFKSFMGSSLLIVVATLVTLGCFFVGRFSWRRKLMLIPVAAGLLYFFPLNWLRQDIVEMPVLRGAVGWTFLTALFGHFLYFYRGAFSRRRIFFEYPALILCTAFFLFENEMTWNWGVRSIQYYTLPLLLILVAGLLGSLHSARSEIRLAVLIALAGIYFLRAHVSVFTVETTSWLWHNQRDTYFISSLFSLLLLIGFEHFYVQVDLKKTHVKIVLVCLTGALGISSLLSFQRMNFLRVDSGWMWNVQSSCSTKLLQVLREKNLVGHRQRIVTSPWAVMPGSLLPLGIHHLNVYDSLVTSETKGYLQSSTKRAPVRPECRLPYPWLPNNFHRILGCSSAEREWHYRSTISPSFDFRNEKELRRVGAVLVLTDSLTRPKGFTPIASLSECNDSPEHTEQVQLYASSFPAPPFAVFQEGITGCKQFDSSKAHPIKIKTDLYDAPSLKSRFTLSVQNQAAGCLMLRVTPSRFWSFSTAEGPRPAEAEAGVFTKLWLDEGPTEVTGRYFASLPVLLGLGVLLQMLLGLALISQTGKLFK